MSAAWFRWRGQQYPIRMDCEKPLIGCPQCGDGVPCDGEPRDEMWLGHQVMVAADGAATVTPSVVCPRGCGWHVVITNGEAVSV